MNRCLYTLLYYLLLPCIFLRLLWRSRKAPNYAKRWPQRLGFFQPPPQTGGIWLHTVSVGETIAAAPLVKQLQQAYPGTPITITTMTPTGSDRVQALFGDSVFHVYVPYDIPGAVNRFLKRVQPKLLLIMETELWPNLIHYSARDGLTIAVMNARLSERSARGYQRFLNLTKDMLAKLDLVAAQTEQDGARLVALGLPQDHLQVTGSIKFDIDIPDQWTEQARSLRSAWGERPVWIAASTHAGEDEPVLDALQQLLTDHPNLLLVLVPRHPERFGEVAVLCESKGFKITRRSQQEPVTEDVQILLGDTMGELVQFYASADVAFVGGTLAEVGGHNFLEPAALGVPIICGPHQFNFAEIAQKLMSAGAMREVQDGSKLCEAIAAVLVANELQQKMGSAGQRIVEENRGAQQRLFALIKAFLD